LAVYTGLRQGEILGLHNEDIDLDNGVIKVKHQVTVVRGHGIVVTEPKSATSLRPVTLPQSAINALAHHLEQNSEVSGLVFTTTTGKPVSPRNVYRHFKIVTREIGLPEIRFHDLRHTHATLLLAAGVHPKIVQERLGHSQISLTLDTYSHVIPSLQTKAAEQIEGILR
jgi:integrase